MNAMPSTDKMMVPIRDLLTELGLTKPALFYRDSLFLVAIAAGFGVTVALRMILPESAIGDLSPGFFIIFSWILWSPLLEELLFRGIVQGQLHRLLGSRQNLLGLSYANWVASAAFAGFHFIHHPPLWAAAVFLPSLIFGYFRDRFASILPAMVLHSIYNAQFLLMLG